MRFTVSSNALSSKLVTLSKVINSKNSVAILADFLFEVKEGRLHLTASDSEVVMRAIVDLTDSDSDGRFCISSQNLLNAVKGIPEQPITFQINDNDNILVVNYQNGHFSLPIENADEYPSSQRPGDDATEITIPNSLLAENINRSVFATAQDEIRLVMNGIYFDMTPEWLAIVATDGHKLVRNRILTIHTDNPKSFILPKKPATLLKSVLGKDGGDAVIRFDERTAEIIYADGDITCRLIEGRYPNYNSVIPQNNINHVTADRQCLLAALKRVQPFSDVVSDLIRFHVENGTLQLDAQDFNYSKTASERMACDYNGMPLSIGFKGSSFIEILSNFDCQDIIVQLADSTRAGLVVPSEQPEGQDVLMLMMPMLLSE